MCLGEGGGGGVEGSEKGSYLTFFVPILSCKLFFYSDSFIFLNLRKAQSDMFERLFTRARRLS